MAECVALARDTAAEVASRFEIPVFLYEEAAATPARRNLEDVRRGEFEGLAAKMASPDWAPDFGPARPHPTAGAIVIGARMPLIAYNINLATDRLDVAKKIASAIRHSSGGFRFVKAMGIALEDRGIVQVSINLTNYEKTPMHRVFDAVETGSGALRRGRPRERNHRADAAGGARLGGRALPAAVAILVLTDSREPAPRLIRSSVLRSWFLVRPVDALPGYFAGAGANGPTSGLDWVFTRLPSSAATPRRIAATSVPAWKHVKSGRSRHASGPHSRTFALSAASCTTLMTRS